ncbi:MAG: ester cyclase [Crocosphaera sp.]|nr:ester cyclase [Crocosphaera sp.]
MSSDHSAELPLWVQDRNTVLDHDQGVKWRNGEKPDYSHTDQYLHKESKYNHAPGSLEAIAQNLVRTFEMEASHKADPQQWLSIVVDKFQMSSNGGPIYSAEDVSDQGTYNLFIDKTPGYDPNAEDFESSFELFHKAFPNGFLWELIEVLSGPPNITFKWRHWGTFSGPYKDHQPTGDTIEIRGMSVAKVTDDLKILSVEHYFDNSTFLKKLTSGCPVAH